MDIIREHARLRHTANEIATSSGNTVQTAIDSVIATNSTQQTQINNLQSLSIQGGSKTTLSGAVASGETSLTLSPSASGLFLPNEWIVVAGNSAGVAVQRVARVSSGYTTGSTTLTLSAAIGQSFDASGLVVSADPAIIEALKPDHTTTSTSDYSNSLLDRILGISLSESLRNKILYVVTENQGENVLVTNNGYFSSASGFATGTTAGWYISNLGKITSKGGLVPYYGFKNSGSVSTGITTTKSIFSIQNLDGPGFSCVKAETNIISSGIGVNPSTTGGVSFFNESGASGTFTVVTDVVELSKIGLTGNVYKIDNSLGAGGNYSYVTFSSAFGISSTGASVYSSVILRGTGNHVIVSSANTLIADVNDRKFNLNSEYKYLELTDNAGQSTTGITLLIAIPSGAVIYFTHPRISEGRFSTQPYVNAAGSTNDSNVSFPFPFYPLNQKAAIYFKYRRPTSISGTLRPSVHSPIVAIGDSSISIAGSHTSGSVYLYEPNGGYYSTLAAYPTGGTAAEITMFVNTGNTTVSGKNAIVIQYISTGSTTTVNGFYNGVKLATGTTLSTSFSDTGRTSWNSSNKIYFSNYHFFYPIIVFKDILTDDEGRYLTTAFDTQLSYPEVIGKNMFSGSSTFNSTGGVSISLTDRWGNSFNVSRLSEYTVTITPNTSTLASVGEIYIVKGVNSFTVYNTGSNTTATFDYEVKVN